MSSQLKPITVWGRDGPNPPKVAIMLEELGVPYTVNALPITEAKSADYLAINPNGRFPAIQDPNSGINVWESGAIILYLIQHYDPQHKISFAPDSAETALANQWLFYQVSGQGPYYGQAIWFQKYHPEKVLSAVERYFKEIGRVSTVLDQHLAKQKEEHGSSGGGPWLVGNRYSYADMSFFMWQAMCGLLLTKEEYNVEDYPHVKDWIQTMAAREPIKKVTSTLRTFQNSQS